MSLRLRHIFKSLIVRHKSLISKLEYWLIYISVSLSQGLFLVVLLLQLWTPIVLLSENTKECLTFDLSTVSEWVKANFMLCNALKT